MRLCKVCKRPFRLKSKNRYCIIDESKSVLNSLLEKRTVFEAFDCPWCGCQNVVNVREMDEVNE